MDTRQSAAARGYNVGWRLIRAQVLRDAGIPKDEWHLYDVHHDPPYDAKKEPDHTKYKLTPLLHAVHSRETARSNK